MQTLEAFGILSSIVIAVSLMMKNIKRLRLINLARSALFACYGLGIGSLPVFLVNVFIVGIDAWYLLRLRRERADFSLLHIGTEGSEYLSAFFSAIAMDIAKDGERRFYERSAAKAHVSYLRHLGFVATEAESTLPGEGKEYLKIVKP